MCHLNNMWPSTSYTCVKLKTIIEYSLLLNTSSGEQFDEKKTHI